MAFLGLRLTEIPSNSYGTWSVIPPEAIYPNTIEDMQYVINNYSYINESTVAMDLVTPNSPLYLKLMYYFTINILKVGIEIWFLMLSIRRNSYLTLKF